MDQRRSIRFIFTQLDRITDELRLLNRENQQPKAYLSFEPSVLGLTSTQIIFQNSRGNLG